MTLNKKLSKTAYVLVGLAVAVMMAFGTMVTTNSVHAATSTADLQAEIQALLQTIQALKAQLGSISGGSVAGSVSYTFTTDLHMGSTGVSVLKLQQALNADADTRVAVTGAGAPGAETDYYGALTANAVTRFQEKYAAEILYPLGLTKGTGYFGASSRAEMNALLAAGNNSGNNGSGNNNGSSTNNNNLQGQEPSISNFQLRNGSDSNVSRGNSGNVAEVTYNVSNGDAALNRMDVEFGMSNNQRPDRLFQTVALYANGNQIGSVDASNSGNWSQVGTTNNYTIRLSNLNYVTRMGNSGDLVVRATLQNSNATTSSSIPVTIPANGLRFANALGFFDYAPISDVSGASFNVNAVTVGDSLQVQSGNNNPSNGGSWVVDKNNQTTVDPALTFQLQTGANNLLAYSIPVHVTLTANGTQYGTSSIQSLIRQAKLTLNGQSFTNFTVKSVVASTTASTTDADLVFNNLNGYSINGNSTINGSVALTLNNTGATGQYATNGTTTVSVSINPSNTNGNWDIEGNQSGNQVGVTGSTQSSTGHMLTTNNYAVSNVGSSYSQTTDTSGHITSRTYVFTFNVNGDTTISKTDLDNSTTYIGGYHAGKTVTQATSTNSSVLISSNSNPSNMSANGGVNFTYTVTDSSDTQSGAVYLQLKTVAGNSVNKLAGPGQS